MKNNQTEFKLHSLLPLEIIQFFEPGEMKRDSEFMNRSI